LKQQFAAIDKEGRGYIGEKELKEALGLVGFNEVLAKLFAKAFDADQDKIISRDDFMNVMAIMMNGTESEKLDGTQQRPTSAPK
jgi:Ca2+-binding EF-hand superfamily protein